MATFITSCKSDSQVLDYIRVAPELDSSGVTQMILIIKLDHFYMVVSSLTT
jgi:hypothetical protein